MEPIGLIGVGLLGSAMAAQTGMVGPMSTIAMGVFILPIALGLQTIAALTPGEDRVDPVLDSPWFWIHVASLLCAYASFALACVLGVTYMLQFKEIKKKHLGFLYQRLPSLLTECIVPRCQRPLSPRRKRTGSRGRSPMPSSTSGSNSLTIPRPSALAACACRPASGRSRRSCAAGRSAPPDAEG